MFSLSRKLAIACLASIATNVFAIEIRPLFNGYGPSEAYITTQEKNVKSERDWESEYQFLAGIEMNFSAEFSPFRYGFGVGYKSPLKEDDTKIVPASIPVWGFFTVGNINPEFIVSPYAVGRAGVLPLITGDGNWWERPFDFFVAAGLGVILPYRIGLEVNYEYASVFKSFEDNDKSFRISTGKLGVRLSVGIELFRDKVYNPHNRIELKEERTVVEEVFTEADDSEFVLDDSEKTENTPEQPAETFTEPSPEPEAVNAPTEDAPQFVDLQTQMQEEKTEKANISQPAKKKQKPSATKKKANSKKTAPAKTRTKAKAKSSKKKR